jgi:hypothetical protein
VSKLKITYIAAALLCFGSAAIAQDAKPNILFIMGDDIGVSNISAYSHGMMGYRTPNLDGLAKDGAMFTDFYAEQSCTAGMLREPHLQECVLPL